MRNSNSRPGGMSFMVCERSTARRLVDEHDLAEPRWNVRPRLGILRVGPDAHAAVWLHAVPPVEIHFPHGAGRRRAARQLLEVWPRNHRLETPALVGVGANVERPPQGGPNL